MSAQGIGALLERLADRRLRAAAAEEALAAFALVEPEVLRRAGPLPLSPNAAYVIDAIAADPAIARVALVATVKCRLRGELAPIASIDPRQVVRLAKSTAAVTVQDLAQCGTAAIVADLLRDARRRPAALLRLIA